MRESLHLNHFQAFKAACCFCDISEVPLCLIKTFIFIMEGWQHSKRKYVECRFCFSLCRQTRPRSDVWTLTCRSELSRQNTRIHICRFTRMINTESNYSFKVFLKPAQDNVWPDFNALFIGTGLSIHQLYIFTSSNSTFDRF